MVQLEAIKVWDFQPIKASAVEMWSAALSNFKLLPKQGLSSEHLKLQPNFSQKGAGRRVWRSPLAVERGGKPSSLNKEVGREIFISYTPSCPEVLKGVTSLSSAWHVSCLQLCPQFHEILRATEIRTQRVSLNWFLAVEYSDIPVLQGGRHPRRN